MSAGQNTSADNIHPLTSLRLFAAFCVVLYHTLGNLVAGKFLPRNIDTPHPADAAPDFGSRLLLPRLVSVSFFFLLSGYILAIVYLRQGKPIDKRQFFLSALPASTRFSSSPFCSTHPSPFSPSRGNCTYDQPKTVASLTAA